MHSGPIQESPPTASGRAVRSTTSITVTTTFRRGFEHSRCVGAASWLEAETETREWPEHRTTGICFHHTPTGHRLYLTRLVHLKQ
eukprot:m.355928 g.355928  ORF g.355928 m.355928 type:complete len:85 (+) comp16603_c0_seq2:226-480(+)